MAKRNDSEATSPSPAKPEGEWITLGVHDYVDKIISQTVYYYDEKGEEIASCHVVPPEEPEPDVEPAPEPDAPDDAPVSDPDELAPEDPPPFDPRVPPELDAEPESSLPTEPSPDAGTDVRQATLADKTTPRRPP